MCELNSEGAPCSFTQITWFNKYLNNRANLENFFKDKPHILVFILSI